MDIPNARAYINALDLSDTPRNILAMSTTAEASSDLAADKPQAQVVGTTLFAFAVVVDSHLREAIADSALLAQLVANKQASATANSLQWFAAYSEVLQRVGWLVQDRQLTDYTTQGNAAEVHEKIVEVMAVALSPAPAALALMTATIHALQGLQPDSSWLTIFSREATHTKLARFQIGVVEQDPAGTVAIPFLACLIEAQNTITQVLFFKFKSAKASFKAHHERVSIDRASLLDLGPTIRAKVRAYQNDYLSSILDT